MAGTETTQRQWVLIMEDNPSWFKESKDCDNHDEINGVPLCPEHPVERVSWNEVQSYIKKLNALYNPRVNCGATPKTCVSGCFRLPTEAEWEHAARGVTTTAYSFGNAESLSHYSWYTKNNNTNQTQQVALKWENPNGLHDMHGNVWEWVQDYFNSELPGGSDPLQQKRSEYRVIRGGSWGSKAQYLRSANRLGGTLASAGYNIGFRLVRTLQCYDAYLPADSLHEK